MADPANRCFLAISCNNFLREGHKSSQFHFASETIYKGEKYFSPLKKVSYQISTLFGVPILETLIIDPSLLNSRIYNSPTKIKVL